MHVCLRLLRVTASAEVEESVFALMEEGKDGIGHNPEEKHRYQPANGLSAATARRRATVRA